MEICRSKIFPFAMKFDPLEETPEYAMSRTGVMQLEGVFQRAQYSWYRGILPKAAYMLMAVNKGHYFINGNKRLALVCSMTFLYINGYVAKPHSTEEYYIWLQKHFSQVVFQDTGFHTEIGWAMYYLNKCIAADPRDFDTLKRLVERFLRFAFVKVE